METANKLAEFEALLEKSFESGTPKENTVVNGTIIAIEAGQAILTLVIKWKVALMLENSQLLRVKMGN